MNIRTYGPDRLSGPATGRPRRAQSIKRLRTAALALGLAACTALSAAPSVAAERDALGTALDACRAYAKREIARSGVAPKDVVFDRDHALSVERASRKIGNQPISAILSGRAALVHEATPSIELEYVCLLAGDRRPVFLHWTPRRDADVLTRCSRAGAPLFATRPCVEALLSLEESDLTQAAALRFQESREADAAAGNERASDAYRAASLAWRTFRDAECARRASTPPPGADADLVRLACMADLTRQRVRDLSATP
jgi:uncharacterized protein YecT (DUF1311 family)